MIRVVHLFDVKRGVNERDFVDWLDTGLSAAAKRFGCVERSTWLLAEGFAGSYLHPKPVHDRPKYVNEAYWPDMEGPRAFREWLTTEPDGRAMHDRWFSCVQNHTVLRYVRGWDRIDPDE